MNVVAERILLASMVTNYDYVFLRATLEAKHEKYFNCYRCLKQRTSPERLQAIRQRKGCFDTTSKVYRLGQMVYYSCIGNFTHASVDYLIELYVNFQRGIMPFKGGLGEQPNKVIEVFNLIEQVNSEKANAKIEEEKKAAKKHGK